jgi:hypothetical protein
MKPIYKWLAIIVIATNMVVSGNSQTTFGKHEIAKPFTRSAGLALADPDQDGDLDILAGSGTVGFFLYENQGDKPLTWVSHAIDANLKGCLSVAAADIDKDGKTDLLATSWDDNSLVWYRNMGNQTWQKNILSTQCGNAHELFVVDMDGDGFEDVLVAAVTNNEILLFHNPGPGSVTWPRQQISNSFGGSRSVAGDDLDGDGKADIVGAAFDGNKITIWKNMGGNPVQWQPYDLITGYNGAHRVDLADMNQDGKIDIIGWGYLIGALRWWENTGSDFSKWTMHVVDNLLNTSCVGEGVDIDLDGDLDIVCTGFASNQVVWYENTDGKATTWIKHNIDTGLPQPWMAFAGDLDGDLDMDVIAGGDGGNEIRWYENHPGGRMDSYLNYSGGKMNTGIFLPDGYNESNTYELLVALPGASDLKLNRSFRDHLIPVSELRNTIILTPDFPIAVSPAYEFSNPGQINEVIAYAQTRFSVNPERIYLMGAACQGQPAMKGTLNGTFSVLGAFSINPEIQSFNPGEWTGRTKPLAIASSTNDAFYPEVEAFASRLWQDGVKIKLYAFEGSGSDYLIDELADLTIKCMNYIDSANILNHREDMTNNVVNPSSVFIIGSGTSSRIAVKAIPGEHLYIRLLDINGRILYPRYQGPMIGPYMELPLNSNDVSLSSGIYVVTVTGSLSGTNSIRILYQ